MKYYNEFREDVEEILETTCMAEGFSPSIPNLIEMLTEATTLYTQIIGEHRWWNEVLRVVKIGEKFVGYIWAENTGDNSIFDAGWEFDLSSVKFYEPKEVTVTKYVEVI